MKLSRLIIFQFITTCNMLKHFTYIITFHYSDLRNLIFIKEHDSLSQCGKMKNILSPKNISSNQLFSNFFGKNVAFTKFLPKKSESKFLKLPHCAHQTKFPSNSSK